jgi:hypothetical protein
MLGCKYVTHKKRGGCDFAQAKTLLLSCNGTWCPQSGFAIKKSFDFGVSYGKNKMVQGRSIGMENAGSHYSHILNKYQFMGYMTLNNSV